MQLTEHFSDFELGVMGCEARLVENARFLCVMILEPLRSNFGPIAVHDGYRDDRHNQRVGGKPASFHLFEDGRAAADVSAQSTGPGQLFDWLRLQSHLPFDKVILERNEKDVAVCVHIQVDLQNAPRRKAYIGHTGAAEDYVEVQVL